MVHVVELEFSKDTVVVIENKRLIKQYSVAVHHTLQQGSITTNSSGGYNSDHLGAQYYKRILPKMSLAMQER